MKTAIHLILPLFGAACVFICSKNAAVPNDKTLPVITLNSPVQGSVYSAANPLTISATILDNIKLSKIHLHISDDQSGALQLDVHHYPAQPSYNLTKTFTMKPATHYKVQVLAIDNSGNEGIATVLINTQ